MLDVVRLNGCDDELIAESGLELFEMILQIRRWGDEHECIVILHYLVDVGREEDFFHIESCRHQIGRVVPHALEVLDAVVATHIPAYVMSMPHHNLGNGCSPATAANNRYFTAVIHLLYNVKC